ncbi:PLC-like phosphodiesterase [Zopfia rhizophila CBS 207.26]|uniref:PLC-like phosphodiesterase n=1 Tax=Zopfia rhizophila CBS 207.26 TaxID=1314779 RepID=A0A6A6DRH9_9PEZI|nr:PLC-like phosphodiesterase [Zopfia rhizophila CBS 207.26]
MASPLTVRNLALAPISLKAIERFEDPNSQQSMSSAFSFSSKINTTLAPSAPKLGEHAQTFNHQDLNIQLSPFESYTTGTQPFSTDRKSQSLSAASTNIRITIEVSGGERYRIDINPTYTHKSSQSFTPLTPNPSTTYAALYHPATPIPHLTIHNNHLHDLSNWMSGLPSNLPLSALSIPGTHNSHTYYRALPSVRCQVVSVKTQLENGIRFLDIRVQPAHATDTSKKDLYLVHGAFPVSLTGTKYLEPILKTCCEFLENHPGETILISLKREGVGNSTDGHLSQILEKHYITPNKGKWHIGTEIPYLKDVRGKLVLVRRYMLHESLRSSADNEGYGLDATEWPYNSTHAIHGPFCVQDFCEVLHPSSISQKLQYSNEHLVRAAECTVFIPGVNTDKRNPVPAGPMHLNFLSGSNFWRMDCWPDKIAKILNREAIQSIVRRVKRGDGSTGVVVMDCVGEGGDWDLVKIIVGMNMGILMRIKEETST